MNHTNFKAAMSALITLSSFSLHSNSEPIELNDYFLPYNQFCSDHPTNENCIELKNYYQQLQEPLNILKENITTFPAHIYKTMPELPRHDILIEVLIMKKQLDAKKEIKRIFPDMQEVALNVAIEQAREQGSSKDIMFLVQLKLEIQKQKRHAAKS